MLPGSVEWPAEFADRYRREGYWLGTGLGELLRPWARTDPSRTAVVSGARRHSYAELDAWADRLAAGLSALGLGPGDRVVLQLPNSPEFVAVCVALFRIGVVPVLALPAHRRNEITYLCAHTEAKAYVAVDTYHRFDYRSLAREVRAAVPTLKHVVVAGEAEEFIALADLATAQRPAREERASASSAQVPAAVTAPDPGEVAFFLLSGGTTGLPKLIPRTHDDYAYQLRETASAMGFDERGVYLACLPIAHNAALGCPGVLGALWAGGRVVLAGSPSPDEVFPLIAREGVTLTTLMPSFLKLWSEMAPVLEADLSGLVVEVGGARLSPQDAALVGPALGCTLTRWFGMAEGVLSFTRLDDSEDVRVTTEGHPLSPADEFRVVDEDDRDVAPGQEGQLLVRGPCTLRGYYRAPEYNARTFTEDGFLRTGDLVRRTPEGRLVVTGRMRDVVNRAGEKVPAEEVEGFLAAHPRVRDAAVVGLPDPVLGERTCAVVVPEGQPPTLAEVREFLIGQGLAEYKLPDRVETSSVLPRTTLGKLDKRALRAALAQPG
ncbi:(2,3-dihydroxybenzoyl)adenylate synthase [Micromonospora sp. CPCC 206061]|uniref:(2,3-dihydroxybenzoyl)adenylate synthase n=1 Tax=Micromonospora sp. CPCC 206061 TaxID=3122410 RepID=UPI002FF0E669